MEQLNGLFTQPSFVFDIICVILLVLFAVKYARRGLLSTVVGLAGNLASTVGAYVFSRRAAPWLYDKLMAAGLKEAVVNTIQQSGAALDLSALVDQYGGFLPESLRRSVLDSVL